MIHYKRIIAAVAMVGIISPNAFADEGNDGGVVSAFKPDQASQSFTSFRKVSRDLELGGELSLNQTVRYSDYLNDSWYHYGLSKGHDQQSWIGFTYDDLLYVKFAVNDGQTEDLNHYVYDDYYFNSPNHSFYFYGGWDDFSLAVGKKENLIKIASNALQMNNMKAIDRTLIDTKGIDGQDHRVIMVSNPLLDGQHAYNAQMMLSSDDLDVGFEVAAAQDSNGHLVSQYTLGAGFELSDHMSLTTLWAVQGEYLSLNPSINLLTDDAPNDINGGSVIMGLQYGHGPVYASTSIGVATQNNLRTNEYDDVVRSTSTIGLNVGDVDLSYSVMNQMNDFDEEYLNQHVELAWQMDKHMAMTLSYDDFAADYDGQTYGSGQIYGTSIKFFV